MSHLECLIWKLTQEVDLRCEGKGYFILSKQKVGCQKHRADPGQARFSAISQCSSKSFSRRQYSYQHDHFLRQYLSVSFTSDCWNIFNNLPIDIPSFCHLLSSLLSAAVILKCTPDLTRWFPKCFSGTSFPVARTPSPVM